MENDQNGQEPEITEEQEQEFIAAQLEKERALTPYSDNLPYDKNRLIEETKFLLRHEFIAKYEAGKRLVLLKENESCPNFGQLLEEHFPGLSRQRAYEYMLFARKISSLPNLRGFADGKKNWTKALALLESCDEDELAALEAGDSVVGMTLDEADTMTLAELKKALRKEKLKNLPLAEQVAALDAEKRVMAGELAEVKAGKRLPEYYYADLDKVNKHLMEALRLIQGFPKDIVRGDFDFGTQVTAKLDMIERMARNTINDFVDNED